MKNLYLIAMLILLITTMFSGCGSAAGASTTSNQLYRPGTYTGSGGGYFGLITVMVTVTENTLAEIEILSHGETDGIGTSAFEELSQTIIYTNFLDADVIAGATGSSEGMIEAVNDALEQARME
ncbi:MAG: FMN-binding protein [Treponema sp.]|nr:FMN-binding protein [Treponema sp.]